MRCGAGHRRWRRGRRPQRQMGRRGRIRGAPSHIICDNAQEFVGKRFRALCKAHRIHLPPSPPYCSAARGAAENTNRLVRRYLRTAVARLKGMGVRKRHWPLLLRGIEEIHNKTISKAHGISPWACATNGKEPSLDFLLGDPVTFQRPASDTAAKTLDLAGTKGVYMARVSNQECIVLEVHATSVKTHRLAPSRVTHRFADPEPPHTTATQTLDQPPASGHYQSPANAGKHRSQSPDLPRKPPQLQRSARNNKDIALDRSNSAIAQLRLQVRSSSADGAQIAHEAFSPLQAVPPPSEADTDQPMVDVHDCVSSEASDILHDDALYTAVHTTAEAQPAGKGVNRLLYTSPSPRDRTSSRMPSSA